MLASRRFFFKKLFMLGGFGLVFPSHLSPSFPSPQPPLSLSVCSPPLPPSWGHISLVPQASPLLHPHSQLVKPTPPKLWALKSDQISFLKMGEPQLPVL